MGAGRARGSMRPQPGVEVVERAEVQQRLPQGAELVVGEGLDPRLLVRSQSAAAPGEQPNPIGQARGGKRLVY